MLSILYVNYNSTDLLLQSIETVCQNNGNYPYKICVWDNHSKDSVENINELYPDIRIYKSATNIGYGSAINQLLKKTSSKYIVLLNPDTKVVNKNFIEEAVNFLKDHPEVGILGPKILNADNTVQGSARKFPTPLTSLFGRNTLLTKLFPKNPISAKNICTIQNPCVEPFEVDWVSGACMVIRRAALDSAGNFDEKFFMYWEDADFCRRVWNAGWKVMYYPKIEIYHFVGKSSNFAPYRSIYHFHRSCYYLCEKNMAWPLSLLLPLPFLGLAARCVMALLFFSVKTRFRNKKQRTRASGKAY
jgi:GT2 family glycosyltransferase